MAKGPGQGSRPSAGQPEQSGPLHRHRAAQGQRHAGGDSCGHLADTPGRKLEDFASEHWAPSAPPLLRAFCPEITRGMVRPQGRSWLPPESLCRAALAPPGVEQRRGAEWGWRARRAGPLTPLEARGRIGFGACRRLGQKWPPVLRGPPEGPGFVED